MSRGYGIHPRWAQPYVVLQCVESELTVNDLGPRPVAEGGAVPQACRPSLHSATEKR